MKILVINAGSSSVKYQLIDMDTKALLAKGLCERIGIDGGMFTHKVPGRDKYEAQVDMKNHAVAIELVVKTLVDPKLGVISSLSEIGAVGHRVLHGGEKFSGSVLVNDKVKEAIKECFDLGPLHNPANLTGINACEEVMPGVPQVAVFDTGFHQTMPDYAYMYALPYEYYEKYSIRRYGFHGTSHRYVSGRCAELMGKPGKDFNVVTCHLGNGSSVCAVKGGKCYDTSMGVTPLEGIIMGTRCGNIDPAIVPLIMKKEGLTPDQMDTIMNKKSGLLGVTGETSDNRDLEIGANEGKYRFILAQNMLCHQLTKLVGGYTAAMGGTDAIVFCGGIGENNPMLRERVCENLKFMGVKIDPERNAYAKCNGEEVEISAPDSTIKVFVIPTNEELMIATDTLEIVSK